MNGAAPVDRLDAVAGLVASAACGGAPEARDLEAACMLALESARGPGPRIAREALGAAATRMRRLHREGHDVSVTAHAFVRGYGRAFDSADGRERVHAEVRMLCADVADAAWHGSAPPRTPLAAAIEGLRAALAGSGPTCPPAREGPVLVPAGCGVRVGHSRATLRRHPHGVTGT